MTKIVNLMCIECLAHFEVSGSGRRSEFCGNCRREKKKEYRRIYREKNRPRLCAYRSKYYQDHAQEIKQHRKNLYWNRPEKYRKKAKNYYAIHREEISKRRKSTREIDPMHYRNLGKKSRARHREKRLQESREWRKSHLTQERAKARQRARMAAHDLRDYYVASFLMRAYGLLREEVTSDLIRLKKDVITVRRLLRRAREEASL
jgi:hypothetical protein